MIFRTIHHIRPYTLNTIAVLTIKAVMKPGQAHITMKIISIAQRINPIMVVEFYLLLIVPGESRGLSEVVSLSRDLELSCHYRAHYIEKFVSLYDVEAHG